MADSVGGRLGLERSTQKVGFFAVTTAEAGYKMTVALGTQ